ncbi:MAG: hypothetical protein JXA13_07420 [Anaerolineales bacterium]|nr:hypothetical protein [Anaerolineales bacterium]
MKNDHERIAELERINLLAMKPLEDIIPEMEIVLRKDVSLVSHRSFPTPDYNQACLLQATPEAAEILLDEIIMYFRSKELIPTVFVSEACTPDDLPRRLEKRGFTDVGIKESWLIYENVQSARAPKIDKSVAAKQIDLSQVSLFAEVMAAAFGIPDEMVGVIADALKPSIGIPSIAHYLGFREDQAVATLTLMYYQEYVIVGSAGVLKEHRGSKVIYNLAVQALIEAQSRGVETIMLQTSLGPIFERFLRFWGFKQAFKRTGYSLV